MIGRRTGWMRWGPWHILGPGTESGSESGRGERLPNCSCGCWAG